MWTVKALPQLLQINDNKALFKSPQRDFTIFEVISFYISKKAISYNFI